MMLEKKFIHVICLEEIKERKMGKNKKICFTASSGGHYEQLMMLKPLMEEYESIIVTEKTQYRSKVDGEKMYYLKQVNRKEATFIFSMIVNVIKSLIIFLKEKPDVIISTGVLSTIPICLIAKMFRKKLIYIESFAKITSPTETGKLLYKFADRFYVQWESMLEFYPKAIYLGSIY